MDGTERSVAGWSPDTYSPGVGLVEATVKIVTGVAWPIVVIVAVLVLRRQIGRLIERMTHFKGPGGVEADFPSQAAATNELSEEAVPNAPTEMTLPASDEPERGLALPENLTLQDLLREADAHPVGAIVRAWNVVEDVVGRGFGYGPGRLRYTVPAAARSLQMQGRLSDEVVGLAERLTRLRSQVVHGQTIPSTDAARDFVEAAWRLAVALKQTLPPGFDVPDTDDML
jgi:hypothetical protein